jgi:hypothetical protein
MNQKCRIATQDIMTGRGRGFNPALRPNRAEVAPDCGARYEVRE